MAFLNFSEFNIGHLLILLGMLFGGIAAWYRRERDVAILTENSQNRYAANAKRLDEIDTRIQKLNENGSPAGAREMDLIRSEIDMLEKLYVDQQARINSLEEIKPQIATLIERSSHQSQSMKEIKDQLNVLVGRKEG